MRLKHFFFSVIILMTGFLTLHAQETGSFTSVNPYKGNNSHDFNDVSGVNKVAPKSFEQIQLEQQIKQLRSSDLASNRSQVSAMNKQLGDMTGNFTTEMAPHYGSSIVFTNEPVEGPPTDDITNIRLLNSTNAIKGIATFTEQRGANIGRIWVCYCFSAGGSSPDSLRWIYSTNGGINWTSFASAAFGGTDKMNNDGMDMEIIENSSGDKFLWVFYGYRQTGGTGRWQVGGAALNITTPAGSLFAMVWPGDDAAKRYYHARVTSDNSVYTGNAFLYIACSFDSLNAGNVRVNTQKYARVVNPYVSSGVVFSYQAQKVWWFSSSAPANFERDLHTDIAYIRNGTADSVIVSFSNVPDSLRIFFSKMDIGGTPSTGNGATSPTGSDVNDRKQYARLSSNGYANGSIICVFRQFTAGNWNVKYFRTTNYGNFNAITGESTLWGSNVNINYQPDIVGLRSKDVHYFTFNTVSSTDSVHSVRVTPSGGTSHLFKVNFPGLVSGTQGSKPGFRYVTGDSCFTIFSENGPVNVWSALGCSGPITGITSNTNVIPERFSLSQNYPNPFNPVTNIKFAIPVSGAVKLEVFDILGKSVSVLVNENMTAGTYTADFDAGTLASGVYFYTLTAGDFTETKKMLLVK